MKKLALLLLLPALALGQTGIQKDAAGNLTQSFGTGTKTITVSPGGQIYVGPGGILNIDTGADLRFQAGTIDWSSLTAYPTITTTAPLAGGGVLSGSLTLSMPFASATQNGYLKSTDWVAFNTGALSFTTPLVNTAGTITIPVATGAANGYLASGDWTNFQAGYSNRLTSATGTGPITVTLAANALTVGETQASSTGAGWLSAANWSTFNAKQPAGSYLTGNQTVTLSGDATGSGATAITTTVSKINGVAYPSGPSTNTVPVVTGSNAVTYEVVPNAALANPSITIAGTPAPLGTGITLDTITGLSSTGLVKRTAANTLGIASGSDYQTPLSFTSPLVNTSGTVAMPAATASTNGYLKATDWVAFNTGALSFTSPLVNTSGTVSLPIASSIANGYLSSANWITFNGKQTAYTNLTTIGALTDGSGWLHDNGYGTFTYSIPTETDPVVAGKTGIITASGGSISSITDNHTNWDAGYTYRVTGATGNSPITVSLAANALTVGETEASSTSGGYLSAADYANFAAGGTYRLVSATGTPPLTLTLSSNALTGGVTQASTSSNGYVSSTDWTNFQAGYSNRLTSATGSGGLSLTLSANALTGGLLSVPNSSLANSAITIAGTSTALGGTITQDTITGLSSTGLVKRTGANTLGIISDNGLVTNLAGLAPTVGLLESTSTSGAVAVLPLSTYLTSATGVSSITGTSNEIIASGAHGAITLSTPQAIGTGSNVQFNNITAGGTSTLTGSVNVGAAGSPGLMSWINTANAALPFQIGLFAGDSNQNIYIWNRANGFISFGINNAQFLVIDPSGISEFEKPIRLYGLSSGYVGFAAQSAAGSTTYTLPNADGTNNYVLTTDGSGNLSWSAKTGGSGGYITSINGDSSAAQTINATAPITVSNAGAVHTVGITDHGLITSLSGLSPTVGLLSSTNTSGTVVIVPNHYIYATDYGVVADGSTPNDTAFSNALNAAISANATLMLPSGVIKLTAGVSKTPVGAVGIRGPGRKTCVLKFTGATDGLSFNCSTYPATSNYVQLSGFGINAANTSCGLALKIDYGSGSELNSVEDRVLANFYDLEIGGNGWVNGIYLRNAWHLSADHIYLCGNSSTWDSGSGAGSGKAIELISCVNELWNDVSIEYFNKGWSFETTPGSHSCQGILVSQAFWLACNNCVNFTPVDGGDHTDAILFDNFLIDNGNFYGANIQSVYLNQANNFQFSNGEVLQNSNNPAFYYLNCSACKVANTSVYQSGGTVTALDLDGTTTHSTIIGNYFNASAAISCGAGTTQNIIEGNTIVGTFTNAGTNFTETSDTSGNVTFGAGVVATSFNTTSSRRFKENIASLDSEYSLAKVGQLRPVTFDWKPGQGRTGHDFGLIAEEVQEVFPQVVSRDEKGQINGLDYGKLSTVAISAVQQQQGEIGGLRAGLWSLGAVNVILLLWLALRRKP